MLIDPELAAALAAMPRAANGSLMDLTNIPALRDGLQAMAAELPAPDPVALGVTIVDRSVVRDDGSELDLVLFRPVAADPTAALPALLWFHAGGQILGSAHDDAAYHAALARELGCVLVAVDYRLAPETRAPGAAEDGFAAYSFVLEHARDLGIAADRIAIGGASGGGAPATATALMIRDRGLARPCLLSLSYPMLDDRNETPSSRDITDVGVWDRRENLLAWAAVLGDRVGADDVTPYEAPGRAVDLQDMPPVFVAAGQYDLFRDEAIELARRLVAADVPVDLHVYAGAFHAFDRFAPASALTRRFELTWHDALRRHLHQRAS